MKKNFSLYPTLCWLLFAITITSCGKKENVSYSLNNLDIKASGPLFSGANVAQVVHKVDLSKIEKNGGIQPKNIVGAKLTKAEIYNYSGESISMDDVTISIVSENVEMKKIAFLNPVPKNSNNTALVIAQEQDDIEEYFQEKEFTIVADINIAEDLMDDYVFNGNFEFELTINN